MNGIKYFGYIWAVACLTFAAAQLDARMQLTRDGQSVAPIVVAADATPENLRVAGELADYIEKISGAKPELIDGTIDTLPQSAIWVGYHDRLKEAFPGVDFTFSHPEEILIVCQGAHVAILGRDRMNEGAQIEFGTSNAVSTFLQDQLDVRQLWPGPLGTDIIPSPTIEIDALEYRYHPQFVQRQIYNPRRVSRQLEQWTRMQRVQMFSWQMSIGHAFNRWWNDYHKEHPEYFALQPDGTRSGYPNPGTAKLCESEPAVWQQWWQNAEASIAEDPTVFAINAAPNDGSNAGICVCETCLSWDNTDARLWRYNWQGFSQEYFAMTDRYIKFWNILGQGLKERFPDRELFVTGMAYGPAKPPPVERRPDDNVVIGYVGHFPIASDQIRANEKAEWLEWAAVSDRLMFRPNVFWYSGGWHGIPTLAVRNTMEDLRFLAENNCFGLAFDHPPQHWATQGPQYYAMAQFAWNPFQDGEALMKDYYQRGWGPAAELVAEYFQLMEDAHMAVINTPGWRHSMGGRLAVLDSLQLHYGPETLARAEAILNDAEKKLADADNIYRQRLAFVRTGLDYTKNHYEIVEAMKRVRETRGSDAAAVKRALALHDEREALFDRHNGIALVRHLFNITWVRSRAMYDHLGPPSREFQIAAGLIEGEGPDQQAQAGDPADAVRVRPDDFEFTSAAEAGWKLVFSDDFQGDTLGTDWEVVNGNFKVEDGYLIADGGILMSKASYQGPVRLEYFVEPNIRHLDLPGIEVAAEPTLSDISTILYSNPKEQLSKGYFLQFGGFNNTRCRILRNSAEIGAFRGGPFILPGHTHHIVAEFDGTHVRLIVDEELLFEFTENSPITGGDLDRLGFYFWTGSKVSQVNIYTR